MYIVMFRLLTASLLHAHYCIYYDEQQQQPFSQYCIVPQKAKFLNFEYFLLLAKEHSTQFSCCEYNILRLIT